MQFENQDIQDLTEARRKSIAKTIRAISIDELKELGEELFPKVDHPWRTVYFDFIEENAASTFHHAATNDRVQIIYCHDRDKGMWFTPGRGVGPLQEKGLRILKEIVEGGR